ncbi:MAG TPA: hypothetical protein PK694_01965 [Rhodospirillales bacterium]|nr:hypothetical protein [Rhodospirillales bacterium]
MAATLAVLSILAQPAAAAPPTGQTPGGGAVVIKQTLCKISVGQTLPSGTDEVFTFDCSTVLTPSVPAVSTLRAKAQVDGWPGGTYRDEGFACIINRQPVGGGFVCTTDSRTTVDSRGRASLNCKCKLTDPTCKPVVQGKEPCAP